MAMLINNSKGRFIKLSKLVNKMYSSSGAGAGAGAALNEVEFKKVNQIGSITLNRPRQLNALNLNMVEEMHKYLDACERSDDVKAVLVKGAGDVAFCAGGDVKKVRADCLDNNRSSALSFFREEYKLNYKISNYKKPYIALLNGVTMGGGVGLSVHGKYRVATEKTLFAMPETAIGFFADVGGSFFLPRLKNKMGLYLALTGNRIKGQDTKRVGISTHFVSQNNMLNLENELYNSTDLNDSKVDAILNKHDELVSGDYDSNKIAEIFDASNLEEICARLEKDNSEWAQKQLRLLNKMSPTSLKVTIKQLETGSKLDLKKCLEMEYMLCHRFVTDSDFFEGVRSVLVDRGSKPVFRPATFSEVNSQKIDWFFNKQPDDEKLILDSKL